MNYYHIGKKVPPGAIYIGRGNKSLGLPHSPWHNPFSRKDGYTRETAVDAYERYLDNQISIGVVTIDDLLSLAGKDFVCYCAPLRFHGHVLQKKSIGLSRNQKSIDGRGRF